MTVPPLEEYVLYPDRQKMQSSLNKRMLLIFVPVILVVILLVTALSYAIGHIPPPSESHAAAIVHGRARIVHAPLVVAWIPWIFVAEGVLLWLVMTRQHKKQTQPIVVLNEQGLTVNTIMTRLGTIPWKEIQEVRAYTFFYRYVGVVLTADAQFWRTAGRRVWLIKANAWVVPLFRIFGAFAAPINIPQIYLPITAADLVEKIRVYQSRYGPYAVGAPNNAYGADQPGVWPPPPANRQ